MEGELNIPFLPAPVWFWNDDDRSTTMKYGKCGIFGGGIVVGLILANLFGGSNATSDKSNATAICSQPAAHGLVQQIADHTWAFSDFRANIDWSTVGGRSDARDSNVFICAVRGIYKLKDTSLAHPITVSYTVALMGSQIQVQGRSDIN
jgi:hypothetical protein